MKKKKISRYVSLTIIFSLAILFVAKFAGQSILRLYIEVGIGTCQQIPVLCMAPTQGIINPYLNKEYIAGLLPYRFPKIEISLPRGFTVVQETIKKVYYKKWKRRHAGAVIYFLHEEPDFFINLFPQLKKQGIVNDYEFIRHTMHAKISEVKDLNDAFFVIMKGIFTPDLGEQKNVKMAYVTIVDKRGFINYNLAKPDNYFDCNIINSKGDFFKIYIKDKGARLDLDKVFAIISTVDRNK
jgi:hypothetical protein